MIIARKITIIFLCMFSLVANAQVSSVGKIVSWEKIKAGIQGRTDKGEIFQVRAYSDHIIRVRVSKQRQFNEVSYALSENIDLSFDKVAINDQKNLILFSTSAIDAEIEKTPSFRIIFKTKQGKVINEDAAGNGFGTSFIGDRVTIYKKLQPAERFVGLGEVLGDLNKRGMGFTLNNTDTYKYGDPRLSMYASIPFYIGIQPDAIYGFFFNNTYKSFFNFGLSTPGFSSVTADGGDADYFFMHDVSVAKVIEHYSSITGRMPLPPLWSLGYHQSRCSYYPQENVKILAETFRKKKIPVDCIVLDADYLKDYEPFRINTDRFPDLAGLASDLSKMNMEITASVNPGIRIDSSYEAHADGLKKDVYLRYADGSLFVSDIAPNTNHFVDFTDAKGRAWWIEKMKFLPDHGIHGYWNDMNEPAVAGSYLPDNLLFSFEGRKANALEAKNIYGMQMARSSFESALKYGKGRRPFILTRSGFAGVQRYAAVWSGDNTATDEFLLGGVLLNSQMGLSGMPFVGPDLGGYIGDGSKELYKRWVQVGVFSPFLRNHKGFFTPANEPWSYGEEGEAISRTFIGFRYRLMPYVYSKFYEAAQTGVPVARSLCIDHPYDDKVYDGLYQYQFLFGEALMVVPVTTQEKIKKTYLPEGDWYDLYSDEKIKGEKEWTQEVPVYQIPLYIKASSVIPMQSAVQSTKERSSDTLFVHVYNGTEKNVFVYYEDEGDGFGYQKGNYCRREIVFDPMSKQIHFAKQQGNYVSVFKHIKLVLHGFAAMNNLKINNTVVPLNNGHVPLLYPLENLSDIYDKNFFNGLQQSYPKPVQQVLQFDNSAETILINW